MGLGLHTGWFWMLRDSEVVLPASPDARIASELNDTALGGCVEAAGAWAAAAGGAGSGAHSNTCPEAALHTSLPLYVVQVDTHGWPLMVVRADAGVGEGGTRGNRLALVSVGGVVLFMPREPCKRFITAVGRFLNSQITVFSEEGNSPDRPRWHLT